MEMEGHDELAFSFQCMTELTTNKKKKKETKGQERKQKKNKQLRARRTSRRKETASFCTLGSCWRLPLVTSRWKPSDTLSSDR